MIETDTVTLHGIDYTIAVDDDTKQMTVLTDEGMVGMLLIKQLEPVPDPFVVETEPIIEPETEPKPEDDPEPQTEGDSNG